MTRDTAQKKVAEAARTSMLSDRVLPGSMAELSTHGGFHYVLGEKKGNTFLNFYLSVFVLEG